MAEASPHRAANAGRHFWRSSTVRVTLIAWLSAWLLNAMVVVGIYDFTLKALTEDIVRDVDRDIETRLSAWPSQLPAHAGVTLWLYRQFAMEIAELDGCVALYEADGELQLTNFATGTTPRFELGEYYTVPHTGHRFRNTPAGDVPEIEPIRHCLVREERLTDGGTLIYGLPFDNYLAPIEQLRRLRFWGLLLTATFSLLLAAFIARHALQGIHLIARACDRVAQGDLKQRLRLRGNDGDLDHIAEAINRMLDQIEQLMGGVREVSDAIAHDLKTPLARLRGQLELLLNLPERSDEAIETVISEADQVLNAFNALLRIAQLEQGTRRQMFVHFRLSTLLQQSRDLYELVFADKQIDFVIDLPAADVELYGDRELWLQALSNLLDNAYKYTPEGGRVTLSARREDANAILQIHDSGPGIPEGEQKNVFQRFYRLERHRSTRGTGLGLALVAAVCKVHQAEITLDNDAGLLVTIRLPVGPAADAAPVEMVSNTTA